MGLEYPLGDRLSLTSIHTVLLPYPITGNNTYLTTSTQYYHGCLSPIQQAWNWNPLNDNKKISIALHGSYGYLAVSSHRHCYSVFSSTLTSLQVSPSQSPTPLPCAASHSPCSPLLADKRVSALGYIQRDLSSHHPFQVFVRDAASLVRFTFADR
jgi:hypothetical protein